MSSGTGFGHTQNYYTADGFYYVGCDDNARCAGEKGVLGGVFVATAFFNGASLLALLALLEILSFIVH